MTPSIRNVIPHENYEIIITYESGETKKFDVKPFLKLGVFRELEDMNIFKSVQVSFDTVEWMNGADIDPEELYSNSVPFPIHRQSIA